MFQVRGDGPGSMMVNTKEMLHLKANFKKPDFSVSRW